MIKYDRLWETMKEKGVTQYDLYTYHNVNRSQLDRLRKNKNVQTNTIDRLCNILHCNIEDIMELTEDDNLFWNNRQKTHGQRDSSGCFSFPQSLYFCRRRASPRRRFFFFPSCVKCLSLQKVLMQSWYKTDRSVPVCIRTMQPLRYKIITICLMQFEIRSARYSSLYSLISKSQSSSGFGSLTPEHLEITHKASNGLIFLSNFQFTIPRYS